METPTAEELGYVDSDVLVHEISPVMTNKLSCLEFSTSKKGQYMASDVAVCDLSEMR